MNKITFPLRLRMQGPAVSDLQNALQVLLERSAILANDPAARRELSAALASEHDAKTYGNATGKLVSAFQQERRLLGPTGGPSGEVDEPTARALNELLEQMQLLNQPAEGVARSFVVSGQVRRENGLPLAGMRVQAVHQATAALGRTSALRLGEDATDAEGRYTIRYEPLQGPDGINLRVTVYDGQGKSLRDSGVIGGAKPLEIVDLVVPDGDIKPYAVGGKVGSRLSSGLGGLRVAIVDKSVGGDVVLAQATTDERGAYQVAFSDAELRRRGKAQPDLQARVFASDTLLGASEVRYNASQLETLDVLLDDKATPVLQSEHEVLTGALRAQFNGKLADLKETKEQQDITYLAHKTGWDARAVALAALADQFSARTASAAGAAPIPQAFFYALFRAGLPANEDALYQTDIKTLEEVWKKAADQGVISKASADQIPNVARQFQTISAQKLLAAPALIGTSSFKDMLGVSRLGDAQQTVFAQLYATNRADMPAFWRAVGNAFGQETANRLQVNGKLGFLTINNAPLMQNVHTTAGTNGLSDPLQLAQMGYHRAESWSQLLTADVPIPKEIPGDTPEARRTNYANYLAAQVRLSYPTASVAQMVKTKELPLTGAANGVSDQVHAFLTQNQGKFEIGVQPVQHYIASNNLQVSADVVSQVKRLQRVYQITPSDQALTGLMKRGVDAAYHVVRYQRDAFVQSFAGDVGGADHAALTYDKSVQIHNAVLNIAVAYLNARTAPPIGVHGSPSVVDPAPANANDVIAYATLESVFGSMDFCSCEHCRSILSPAAYLVDLLLFIQSDSTVWSDFLKTWKQNHGNAPYPFASQNAFQKFQTDWNTQHPGQPLPNTEISPFDVLTSRRPDIQHLPLTCENINTALPYIDVVNETLEYFVANSVEKLSLNGYLGHDTNGATSEDLLASPQFVMESAYTILRNKCFPASLPFHQPLENLRRYFNKFEVPLPLVMERLRKSDDLERGANPYGWRDILMEEISLSRDEYEVLTNSGAVPLWRMYGFPDGTADADVNAGLSNAKLFAQRVGITYSDLVTILRTRFINPDGDLVPKLERLGVSFATLKALKDGTITDAAFDALLPTGLTAPDPAEYGGDIKAWTRNGSNYARIMGLVTLTIPASAWTASKAYAVGNLVRPTVAQLERTLYYECTTSGTSAGSEPNWPTSPGQTHHDGTVVWTCRDAASCSSFDHLAFRYSDPGKVTQNLSAVEFVRLLRFIRLWKKLGWTIEQTDAAITAFYRADLAPLNADDIKNVDKLNAGFLTLLPRLGILTRVMRALNLKVKSDLLSLLACWSEIGTHSDTALYREMFLNPALLKQDPVFADNGYGEFLVDMTKKLAPHAEALRSAFNLSGDEYDRIVAHLGYDTNTSLTVRNVSAIYRRGWLARKLKFSVRELLLLIELAGLDPFAAPDPTNPEILRLIALVHALKERSIQSAALYLIWNQDLSDKSAPDPAQVLAFARLLRLGLVAVETEFAVVDDPDGAIAQARIAMVYGANAASFFFGLLNDTLNVKVEFSDPDGTLAPGAVRQAIESAAGKTDAGVSKITYDDFRKRLSYSGVLTTGTRDSIKAASGAGAIPFKTAIDSLSQKSQDATNPFFARYPELLAAYDAYVADTAHPISEKRSLLLKAVLPELVKRRKRQQALLAVSSVANTDLSLTQTFLDFPTAPFPIHTAGGAGEPALNDLLAVEKQGLAVQFFSSDTATGPTIPGPDIASDLDYAPLVGGTGQALPANPTPGAAISGMWSGYLEAPESGFFNLRIEVDAGATVALVLDRELITLHQNATLWVNAEPIELRAGTLYSIKLTVEKVRQVVRAQWEWEPKGQGRTNIPARYLYPAAVFEAFKNSYVRFLKVASLAMGLGLTADEIAYFATHSDYQIAGDGWLNALSVNGSLAPSVAAALLRPLEALLEFARIKTAISSGDESLLTVLKDPIAATQNADNLLFSITRWNQISLTDVLVQFGGNIAGLGRFNLFCRAYEAFALIQTIGISARALIQATTNNPTADTVRDLQAALRARYDAASWRDVVRPINDEMRSLQRDALVSYIIHQMRSHPESEHIDTPDKLFEYFLMDVQMDPCMQTSRIRHALSSVQLFIERCLMNLEPRVSPAAINSKQWEWMKRYRVWEANRKVYLFPENWLEPELRDDKSPFFKEIESELLQSDITEERAGIALLNYLSKLEEVAKLELCGIHYVPADPAKRTGEINHVVARTAGAHRKYFYRRYEYGYWTAWEQIKLDIEDNPVIPVVWNDRLFLMWLRILKQGSDTPKKPFAKEGALTSLRTSDIKADPPKVTVSALLCWSEYYNGKWQPTRTSDVALPLKLDESSASGFERSKFNLAALFWTKGALRIIVSNATGFAASFFLHNAFSVPELREGKKEVHFSPKRGLNTTTATLNVSYPDPNVTNKVLENVIDDRAIQPNHPFDGNSWEAPFLYEDARHAFYVTTSEEVVWVPQWNDFGIYVTPPKKEFELPPLVFQPEKIVPDPIGPVIKQPGFGVVDPNPVERYVTEDAYIHNAIGTSGTVSYGEAEVGLTGSQMKGIRTR
jgi:hypothetical protein